MMEVERQDVAGGAIVCLYAHCEECGSLLNEGGVDMGKDTDKAEARALDALRGAWKNSKRWGYARKIGDAEPESAGILCFASRDRALGGTKPKVVARPKKKAPGQGVFQFDVRGVPSGGGR